jgi:hypothetical protein
MYIIDGEAIKGDLPTDFWATVWPGVAFDLNGTLDTYSGWEGEFKDYPLRPAAIAMLRQFLSEGFYIAVSTAQPNWRVPAIWAHVQAQIGPERNSGWIVRMVTNNKLPFPTVCDRSLTFDGNYKGMVERIRNFRAWWESPGGDDNPTPEQARRLGLTKWQR